MPYRQAEKKSDDDALVDRKGARKIRARNSSTGFFSEAERTGRGESRGGKSSG